MTNILSKLASLGYEPRHDSVGKRDLARSLPDMIGFSVPHDYLQFLSDRPMTGFFDQEVLVRGEPSHFARDGLYPIEFLFAADPSPVYDLLAKRDSYIRSGQLPDYLLAFGGTCFGQRVCMDLRSSYFGFVYYWLHDEFLDRPNFFRIADSFSSFIDKLVAQPLEPAKG